MVLKREKLGLKDGCLKKERGAETPLRAMKLGSYISGSI